MTTTTTITVPHNIHLRGGGHEPNDRGEYCFVEAWTYLRGLDWTDQPACMSPTVAAFLRGWNDGLPEEQRTRVLARYLTREFPAGTPEDEERRSCIALDWLIRTHLPAWLRAVPALIGHAERIEVMPEIVDLASAETVGDMVRAARAAAWAAARDAAGDAAWATAGDAARDAARAAAGVAAWDAARDAARDAAWAAAGDAARDAARDAAWAAARAAARDAAWATARAAARAALTPVVATLQESAHACIERMAAVSAKPVGVIEALVEIGADRAG